MVRHQNDTFRVRRDGSRQARRVQVDRKGKVTRRDLLAEAALDDRTQVRQQWLPALRQMSLMGPCQSYDGHASAT